MWIKGSLLAGAALSVLGSGLTAAHYGSHAYARFSVRLVGAVVEFGEEKFDSLAAWQGYVRPEPDFSEFDAMIVAEREALARGINPALARAVVHIESGKKQFALSPKGAIGFMQIMPFNAKRCGLKEPGELLEKVKNIRCGVHILDESIRAQRDVVAGLQEYNGGAKCVGRCSESIAYARSVLMVAARDLR